VTPLLYAHRGVWDHAPQNSVASIRAAIEAGADGVEVDLRLTSDYQLVLCHDPSFLGREIAESTLDELQRLAPPPLRIPTLKQAFGERPQIRTNLEIKPQLVDRAGVMVDVAYAEISSIWSREDIARLVEVSSFQEAIIEQFALSYPEVPRFLLVDRYASVSKKIATAKSLGCVGINLEWTRATRTNLRRAADQGLLVGVWTVDSLRRAQSLSYSPVSHIITNKVVQLRKVLPPNGRS
jgi:glycerophosphoryl diester phosphodiesterase